FGIRGAGNAAVTLFDIGQQAGSDQGLSLGLDEQVRAVVVANGVGQLVGQQGRQFIGAVQILQHGVGDVDVAVRAGLAAEYGVGKQVGLARQPADSGGLLEPLQLLVDVALGFRV